MSSLVNPEEAEIVNCLELTQLCSIDSVRRQVCGGELLVAGVVYRVGYTEVSDPIANVIGVTSPGQDSDSTLDDFREGI
jgi:hypothetical protein